MKYIMVLLLIIIIICISLIIIIYKLNKMKSLINRIDKCEKDITNELKQADDLTNRSINIIERKLDIKDSILTDIKKVNSEKFNNIEKDNLLTLGRKKIIMLSEEYEELKKVKSFPEILQDLNKIEDDLIALRTYHNKYASEFNTLINKFPNNIISKFAKYKVLSIYEGATLKKEPKN